MSEAPFQVNCPACRSYVPMEDLNISKDLALCRNCGKAFPFLDAASYTSIPLVKIDPNQWPKGVWYRDSFDGFIVGANTRSWAVAFLIPFMCAWSGISLGGIFGRQITKGRFDPFMTLFGLPFLLGSIALFVTILMMIAGKNELRVDGGEGRVFTGVGPFGWTRRFDWNRVRQVEETLNRSWNHNGAPLRVLRLLLDQQAINFGAMLNDEKRYFLAQILRRELALRGKKTYQPSDDFLAP